MSDIPWNDEAVLVRSVARGGDILRTIEDEGTLHEVVGRLSGRSDKRLAPFTIRLPDRAARPYAYVGEAIETLMSTLAATGSLPHAGDTQWR